jgi:uncharacterized membrane protein YtjA (UPF0391 family)
MAVMAIFDFSAIAEIIPFARLPHPITPTRTAELLLVAKTVLGFSTVSADNAAAFLIKFLLFIIVIVFNYFVCNKSTHYRDLLAQTG